MSQLQRAAVVAEARTWIGTPYLHQSRLKRVGCDCAQLPIAVYSSVGLCPAINPDYSPQWMLHRYEEQYLGWVEQFAHEITLDQLGVGDFIVWKFGRTFSHGGIVVDPAAHIIIHACIGDGLVLEADWSREADLPGRAVKYYSPWDQT
jgi:cell wall-associated NlpC family hydrolase